MSNRSIRVLLVEDNPADARLVRELLEEIDEHTCSLTQVTKLSAAVQDLRDQQYDVVLLDLGLPDSHGLDTLELLRAQVPTAPVVVLTGYGDREMAARALAQGAQAYLVKGLVDADVLGASISAAIRPKHGADDVSEPVEHQAGHVSVGTRRIDQTRSEEPGRGGAPPSDSVRPSITRSGLRAPFGRASNRPR